MTTPETIQRVAELGVPSDAELSGEHDSERARALLARILADPVAEPEVRLRTRRRVRVVVALPVAALAAVGVAIVIALGSSSGAGPASAATSLREAAHAAAAQTPLVVRPGEYLYTKSVDAYTTTSEGATPGTSWTAVLPQTRETWFGLRDGRLHTTYGTPFFLSDQDRAQWVAAGKPEITGSPKDIALGALEPVALPDDPAALYAKLQADTAGYGSRRNFEMFTLIGDSLRETNASPAQRAALYAVAAKLPGVDLVGPVRDSTGRSGIAVAMSDLENRVRQMLVFDPDTADLLEEREVTLRGNSFGYPADTQIGYATYLTRAVVGSRTATP